MPRRRIAQHRPADPDSVAMARWRSGLDERPLAVDRLVQQSGVEPAGPVDGLAHSRSTTSQAVAEARRVGRAHRRRGRDSRRSSSASIERPDVHAVDRQVDDLAGRCRRRASSTPRMTTPAAGRRRGSRLPLQIDVAGTAEPRSVARPDELGHARATPAARLRRAGPGRAGVLQVLAGVGGGVDRAAGLGALAADERADVDDPLALLARDPRPVVGVGGVGQVLVLLELVDARRRSGAAPAGRAGPVSSSSLIAIFFARSTMFWIIAPELKSLKYRTSLSPLA